MLFTFLTLLAALGIFLGMLAMLVLGRRLGARHLVSGAGRPSLGAVEGAVFGLLGLLMAFTFSGAASRFDGRRQLIVQEANAIGTAYLRLDLLPSPVRDGLREDFRHYLDARLGIFQNPLDSAPSRAALDRSVQLQNAIWSKAVAAVKAEAQAPPAMLLLPALNEMIDITATRAMAAQTHPPLVIYLMLGVLTLVGALFAGYSMAEGRVSRAHLLGFAALFALTIFVILDLEYPRLGLIRVEAADQVLVDLRAAMT